MEGLVYEFVRFIVWCREVIGEVLSVVFVVFGRFGRFRVDALFFV